jgi:hypothetical protein
MIFAGIDEAGYGPTLGPLVVSVSVFRLHDGAAATAGAPPADLWTSLGAAVARKPDGRRVPVDDSKRLFQRRGLRDLEEGLLPFLALRRAVVPRDFRSLLGAVVPMAGESTAYLDTYPWYRERNVGLPRDTYAGVIRRRAELLAGALEEARVEHIGLSAIPIEVRELNRSMSDDSNKADVSFAAIGSFLGRLWKQFPDEPVEVFVDRQGGRVRYGPLLYEKVSPRGLRIEEQSPEASCYILSRRHGTGTFRVHFAKESEQVALPVALASMLSKYVRELHMHLFNAFWREHSAALRPTAGYALDARRFLGDIAHLRRELRIEDELLVRRR